MQAESAAHPSRREHPFLRSLVLVLGVLVVFPASLSYFVLSKSLRSQNVCHVGPILMTPSNVRDIFQWHENRKELLPLYGTYTTFDDASYYFVKTPYDIQPQCLPSFGWWSITTLALTLISPKLRQSRQLHYRREGDTHHADTSPAIQWDQTHRIKKAPKLSSNQHSSSNNRWCAINKQDVRQYHRPENLFGERRNYKRTKSVFGEKSMLLVQDNQPPTNQLFRICGPSQASIISSGEQAPYFVELPLQPPEAGRWQRYEVADYDETRNSVKEYENYDDDGGDDSIRTKYKLRSRPTNPFQLQVQCHVRDMAISHLANGSLQPDTEPHMGWEHAEFIASPVWNPLELPATFIILLGLLLGNFAKNEFGVEDRHLIRWWQQGWTHSTWGLCSWTLLWVYIMGACLEPLIGSLTLITMHITLFLWVSLWCSSGSFIWIAFGFTVVLAQLEPALQLGPVQIFAVSFGDSTNALKLNVLSVLIGLYPMLSTSSSDINWKLGTGVVFMGWALTHTLCQEILAAPQWTIPTILMGDLWWKLQQLSGGEFKKTDDELEPIIEGEDEDNQDSMSRDSSLTTFSNETDTTTYQRIMRFATAMAVYIYFMLWFIMTLCCSMTFDWTLVIGHVMVLWIYIGSTTFPMHPLWSLYHMVAACVLIVVNVMTLVGWILCHVAIRTHAQYALPPTFVWASLFLQTVLHTIAFLTNASTNRWNTSANVPGHFLWSHVKVIGDEILLRGSTFR